MKDSLQNPNNKVDSADFQEKSEIQQTESVKIENELLETYQVTTQ
jgi:hypothetical protein